MWAINNELYHHGIKGQKWGQRNYQNKDGSLTAAGEARYLVGGNGTYGGQTAAVTAKTPKSAISKTQRATSKSSKNTQSKNTNEEWQTPGERLKNKYKNDKKFRYAVNTTAKVAVVAAAAVGTKIAIGSAAQKKGAKIMDDLKAEGLMKESNVFKGRYEVSRAAMDEYTKRMGRLGKINKIIN
jgi:hypothetical protein